jgi:hypothetical protein
MTEASRIPQEAIDKARSFDVMAIAARYGFTGKARGQQGEAIGPCPGCGGRDRFAANGKKNIWSCRQGGGDPVGGDAVALIRHVENCSFPRAVEILTGDLSTLVPKADTSKVEADENLFREKERLRAFNLWREGSPFPDRGAVAAYLAMRGLDIALARLPGAHCREHDDFPYWHFVETAPASAGGTARKQWRIIHRGPAMLWPIVAMDGHFLGLHATWLDATRPKGKAEIFDPATGEMLPAKKVRGSKKGGRIILRDVIRREPDGAVGEGIETVLSWAKMGGFSGSLYSAVDLGNLAGRAARSVAHPTLKMRRRDDRQMPQRTPGPDPHPHDDPAKLFAPHPGTERLFLLGDGDSDSFATTAAMQRAQTRLAATGIETPIEWAPTPHDFNSLLMERIADGVGR